MKDCKYRLPCNWCDKYDRMCDAVLFEIYKQEEEKNTKLKECEHKWRLIGYGKSKNNSDILKYFYFCHNCGATFESDYEFEFK